MIPINNLILENLNEGIIVTDIAGIIIFMNKMAESITEYNRKEALNQSFSSLLKLTYYQSIVRYEDILGNVLNSQAPIDYPRHFILVTKSNTKKFIILNVAPLLSNEKGCIGAIVNFHDVTHRVKARDEQIKRDNLKSLGLFAGRIAHDFNNILTGILGNISLAKSYINNNPELLETLKLAEQATERGKNATQQLFSIAKEGITSKEIVPIEHLLQEILREIDFEPAFQIISKFGDNLWPIEIEKEPIKRALKYIIINAKESMPKGGSIEINVQNCALTGPSSLPLKPDDYIVIDIKDHGQGISKENRLRLFDPFFTTKKDHIGIGLSTAFSALTSNSGFISTESEIGKGTTFNIFLPAKKSAINPKDISEKKPVFQAKTKKVLIVDDEEVVRKVGIKLLQHLGYFGTAVHTDKEALEIYKTAKESKVPFDFVILDLTLANGVTGIQILDQLRKIEPGIKAIISTGYSTHPILGNYREYGFKGALIKPYTSTDFEKIISQIEKA